MSGAELFLVNHALTYRKGSLSFGQTFPAFRVLEKGGRSVSGNRLIQMKRKGPLLPSYTPQHIPHLDCETLLEFVYCDQGKEQRWTVESGPSAEKLL